MTPVKLQCARCDAWVNAVIMQPDGWGLCRGCNDEPQPTTEITVASCYIKPGDPLPGWGVSFGDWTQDGPTLGGFASAWDAWAFAVAATGIDPHARLPESVRRDEGQPQPDLLDWEPEPYQLNLL